VNGPEPTELPLLTRPTDGIPALVDTPAGLAATVEALASGTGPIAVDTERAQSFRYTGRAYLLQFRREGSGTHLLDPIAFEGEQPGRGLEPLADALAGAEWIIHAASQDLPCLALSGLLPDALFDTELAARLLGLPRVALGTLVEQYFGVRLLKEHSAADWSARPLPTEWLAYAALDVELLAELRAMLAEQLVAAGKDEWARQEFTHLVATAGERPVRTDPWRRTSGLHAVRNPTGLAVVRELWTTRDEIARRLDRAPSKILADRAISELAALVDARTRTFPGRRELRGIALFRRKNAQRYEENWLAAVQRAAALTRAQLPPLKVPSDDPGQPRSWESREPEAFARWQRMRPAVVARAEELVVPVENLITPDHLRRLVHRPPEPLDAEHVDAFLAGLGTRPWQREQIVPLALKHLGAD